ncbi:hypothetical protein D3C84_607380 [compost metagenome]
MLDVPAPSRAGSLPQVTWRFRGLRLAAIPCGSGLAREGGVSGDMDVECAGPFASRLAPTGYLAFPGFASGCNLLWERPCSGQVLPAPSRAGSHRLLGVSGGLRLAAIPCGSGLAREGGVSGDMDVECAGPFASRLAPTGYLAFPGFASGCNLLWERPCSGQVLPAPSRAGSHRLLGVSGGLRLAAIPCGSGLAREGGVSGDMDVECAGPFASRLAPTGYLAFPGFASGCNLLWERPCSGQVLPAPSRAGSHRLISTSGICVWLQSPVGASLLAMAACQAPWMLAVPAPSRASPLPQVLCGVRFFGRGRPWP